MISKYRRSAYDSAALVIILLVVALAGCSHTNSVEEQLPYYVTPASALDPQPDAEMLRYLLDSSTFHIGAARQKRYEIASLEDSIKRVVTFAVSKVSEDPAT